jgi:hypothetical protein
MANTPLDGRARLDAAIDEANASLAKAAAALESFRTSGADVIKSTIADLDKRLDRLKETQDAFAAPLHRRKG